MDTSRNSKWVIVILFIIFAVLNALTLKNGHNWGGDFSQYLLHAKNIASGRPYTYGLILDAWAIYPPGFPLLLAPLVKLFGYNLIAFKFFNIIWWGLFAFFSFLILRLEKKTPVNPHIYLFYLLSSPYLFTFKQSILSDLPFMAITTAAIYYFTLYFHENKSQTPKDNILILALTLMVLATLFRYAGFTLYPAAIIYVVFIKKKLKIIWPILIAALISFAIPQLFKASSLSYFREWNYTPLEWIGEVFTNISYSINSLIYLIFPDIQINNSPSLTMLIIQLIHWIVLVIPLVVLIRFFYGVRLQNISFVFCFITIYFLGTVLWPLVDGARYLIPIYGWCLIAALDLIKDAISFLKQDENIFRKIRSTYVFLLTMLCSLNIFATYLDKDFDDNQILNPQTKLLMTWMKNNLTNDDVFMFFKPRVLSLYTEKKGVMPRYSPQQTEFLPQHMRKYHVTHFIQSHQFPISPLNEIYSGQFNFTTVWQNSGYTVYQISY